MEIKQGALGFDVENSIAPLLAFRKHYVEQVNIYLKRLLLLWDLTILRFTVK